MEPIRPQPGSIGDPRHFVGRRRTTNIAERRLTSGTNLALTDPRRMGKSSWIEYYCTKTTSFDPVYIDYQGVRTVDEFAIRTAEKLGRAQSMPRRARSALTAFFDNLGLQEVTAGPVKVKVGVRSLSATELLWNTLMAVNEHAADRPVLVCMDEVPWAIRNIAAGQSPLAACELLQTMRALRTNAHRIRWIVCGSIGFHHVLRQCGATVGEINDLDNLPLGPLEEDEAAELAERLLLRADRQPDRRAIARLATRCGGIPFLMHKVASLLEDAGRGPVGADQLETAFVEFIDDRDDSRAVTHLLERLDPNYEEGADLARRILDALAAGPQSFDDVAAREDDGELLREVVDFLIDDHYLRDRDGLLEWRYDVLRYVWARRRRLKDGP